MSRNAANKPPWGNRNRESACPPPLPTPSQIVSRLNEYVIGQDEVKKTLATAVYNHYNRIKDRDMGIKDGDDLKGVKIEKSNIVLVGPTGCGKTLLAKTIAQMLDVPFAIADATTLTEAGYVGEDVENVVRYLYNNANYNKAKTERGIVWIDECFPGDTEVMTEYGFKRFDAITEEDKILEWHNDGSIHSVAPIDIIRRAHTGGMLEIRDAETGSLLHYSTPGHNRIIGTTDGDERAAIEFKHIRAEESTQEKGYIPVSGIYYAPERKLDKGYIRMRAMLALAGEVMDDGSSILIKKEWFFGHCAEALCLDIKNYCHTLPENAISLERAEEGIIIRNLLEQWYIPRAENNPRRLSYRIPDFINSSIEQREAYLMELIYLCNPKGECKIYDIDSVEGDFLQEIAHLSGFRAMRKGKDIIISEGFYVRQQETVATMREDIPELVFCVTVPSHAIMIRQDGNVCITGNCDKIATKTQNTSITRDVSGEGVQQALLKIIEGTKCHFPLNGGRKHPQAEMVEIDTTNILFICGGAFVGLDKIIEERIKESKGLTAIGFASAENEAEEYRNVDARIMPEDLIAYGLIPEFVGRLPIVAEMQELTEDELVRVLIEPKNSLTKQYRKLLKRSGIELRFEESFLREMAQRAIKRKVGARGLRAELEEVMRDIMFAAPDNKEQGKVITLGTKETAEDAA